MSEVAFILSGSDNAEDIEAVEAYLARNAEQASRLISYIERKGYSYNNAVSHWIEAVAHGFAITPLDASDYQVFCKARLRVKSL